MGCSRNELIRSSACYLFLKSRFKGFTLSVSLPAFDPLEIWPTAFIKRSIDPGLEKEVYKTFFELV